MARILTGITSNNIPHLGNILGAVIPAIELSKNPKNESFLFIADLHALISSKDPAALIENTKAVAATWLAFGFDTKKNMFYRQSRVAEVTELTWYLNCFTPYPMLANAHSFKDKSDRLSDVNSGLFTYPVLMAADIILYDANKVPVGKDQMQHLEMTRDIATAFNNKIAPLFVIPEGLVDERVMIVPGTDGQKMSKSYNNFINIFLLEKDLKKVVMGIITDSTPLESPKNPDTCNAFKLYQLLASKEQTEAMCQNYLKGNYGYGHAKTELFELIMTKYAEQRKTFTELMNHPTKLEEELSIGEAKAKKMAQQKLSDIRKALGYA